MDKLLKITAALGIIIVSLSILWSLVVHPYQKEIQDQKNYFACVQKVANVCKDNKCSGTSSAEYTSMIDLCVKSGANFK